MTEEHNLVQGSGSRVKMKDVQKLARVLDYLQSVDLSSFLLQSPCVSEPGTPFPRILFPQWYHQSRIKRGRQEKKKKKNEEKVVFSRDSCKGSWPDYRKDICSRFGRSSCKSFALVQGLVQGLVEHPRDQCYRLSSGRLNSSSSKGVKDPKTLQRKNVFQKKRKHIRQIKSGKALGHCGRSHCG